MTLRITDQAYATDTGRQRSANEDSVFVRAPLFVIADGMGGARAGEVASKTVVEAFDRPLPEASPERVLKETIEGANRTVYSLAREDPNLSGMGTTTTAAILDADSDEVAIGHVGDSRAYRLRRGKLERLTRDHSLVEEMRRKGQLTESQAEDHPQRSIITRSVGPEPEVEVDLQTVPAQAGDIFLLCSDGLTTMLDDEHVERLLNRATSMPNAVRALVDEANRAGGRDNISVIAFKVVDAAEPALDAEGATLIGSSAAEAGLTATEVRRRAAADAARARREKATAVRPGRRRRIVRRVAGLVALLLVIGGIVFGATYGLHHTWFLGTDEAGRVTLYRGVPYELPFGVKLYTRQYSSPVQTESLPERRKDAVTGQSVRSRADAVKLLEEIERAQGVTEATTEAGAGGVEPGGGE
ncbi:MAG: Stp1/IreP family PP2C-type Ser/Thr phosphatase [Actinobacteria bacterium]|nr:Stp1/IreP family PP2C-type Ser/Thr phosphatase [Actinomycetota bacterium]